MLQCDVDIAYWIAKRRNPDMDFGSDPPRIDIRDPRILGSGQQLTKTTTNAYPEAAESLYTASYDAANRMTSITTKGTGAPATAGRAATDETFTFTYAPKEVPLGDDANGNMAQKRKPDNSDTTTFSRFHVAAILVYAEQEPRRNFLRCSEFSR